MTNSDRAQFDLNTLVSSLGTIMPKAAGTIVPLATTRAFKSNSALAVTMCYYYIITYRWSCLTHYQCK